MRALMDNSLRLLASARRAVWRTRSEAVLVRDPEVPIREVSPRIAVSISSVSLDTVATISTDEILDFVDTVTFLKRLRKGHMWFVARSGEHIIHGSWLGFGMWDLADIGVRIQLNRTEAYLYDCYTAPAYRGNRAFPAVLGACLRFARDRGYRRVYARVGNHNQQSLKAFEVVGFERAIDLLSLRLLRRVGVYVARASIASGPLLETLVLHSARMSPGFLVWRTHERSGIRVNLAMMDRSFSKP